MTALQNLIQARDRLRAHPKVWTKSASARNKYGDSLAPVEKGAVRFSVGGLFMRQAHDAKHRRTPGATAPGWPEFQAAARRLYGIQGNAGRWEDDSRTTLAMVLKVLDEAIKR